MKSPKTKTAIALLGFCIAGAIALYAGTTRSGDWTIKRADVAGKIDFTLIESHHGGHSDNESYWPMSAFQGLDVTKAGRQEVHFTIVRDAGKFDCEGFLDNGEGAGLFHF